jgi:hypothetical protein
VPGARRCNERRRACSFDELASRGARGISNTGADGSAAVIKRSVIVVTGATSNYGSCI